MINDVDKLRWQEKLILRKAIKIQELWQDLIREQGEIPAGEMFTMTIYDDGTIHWYSIKEPREGEKPNVYYTRVWIRKEDENAEAASVYC